MKNSVADPVKNASEDFPEVARSYAYVVLSAGSMAVQHGRARVPVDARDQPGSVMDVLRSSKTTLLSSDFRADLQLTGCF